MLMRHLQHLPNHLFFQLQVALYNLTNLYPNLDSQDPVHKDYILYGGLMPYQIF